MNTNEKLANFKLQTSKMADGYAAILQGGMILSIVTTLVGFFMAAEGALHADRVITAGLTGFACFIVGMICLKGFQAVMEAKQDEFETLFEEEIAEFEAARKKRQRERIDKM